MLAIIRWHPHLMGCMQVGHMWRTTKDISLDIAATWPGILENLDSTARLARYAGPGGWNDAGHFPAPVLACTMLQHRYHNLTSCRTMLNSSLQPCTQICMSIADSTATLIMSLAWAPGP